MCSLIAGVIEAQGLEFRIVQKVIQHHFVASRGKVNEKARDSVGPEW